MKFITAVYMFNATLLLLHEIESAYEKEWEILKLPGRITGFLLLHVPIIILMFWGLIEIERDTTVGLNLALVFGLAGMLPLIVHKIFIRRAERFNRTISNVIIYGGALTGTALAALTIRYLI